MSPSDLKGFWESRLRQDYSLGGVGFAGLGEDFNRWAYRVRRSVFLRVMRKYRTNGAGMDVLDIGSGTGFYIDCWKHLGARSVAGSDITEVAVENLRWRHPDCEVFALDIGGDAGALGAERFDVISAMDVLFHIVDDTTYRRALANIARLLRPGGLLVFSDNFLHGPEQRAEHQVSRRLGFIEEELAVAGLRPLERVPMFVLMNSPVDSSSRLLRGIWWRTVAFLDKDRGRGRFLGAILYPLELSLLRFTKEGPSTELMICRKSK